MHETLPLLLGTAFPPVTRARLDTLQVNLGYRCNQSCLHCHVNAGPNRTEMMDAATADCVIAFLATPGITTLDLTGGAPELNVHFRRLVEAACTRDIEVIDRCNLTVLFEPGQQDTAAFLAAHRVRVVASLPCYTADNVEAQRGAGVFRDSIRALELLNGLGYARPGSGLQLDLVYNPQGPFLPPPQHGLEADYRRRLREDFGICFDRLLTIANMPIRRFGSTLLSRGEFDSYMTLLRDAHQDDNLQSVMCRTLVSVDWRGFVYDCDFNQMLGLPVTDSGGRAVHLSELDGSDLTGRRVRVAGHCYACTAGQGSSCGGALDQQPEQTTELTS